MASTKTKFRCKQQLGKLKEKAKKTVDLDEKDDRDKTDREDSVSGSPFPRLGLVPFPGLELVTFP